MRRKRHGHSRKHEVVELNITAFMNLMVVLVPFLLMTAVFTHLSIIELNLPNLGDAKSSKKDKPEFELHVTLRKDAIMISDSKGGLIKRLPKSKDGYDYKMLTATLKQIKARYPNKKNATILAEQKTEYNHLVQAMDATRMYLTKVDGEFIQAELFPDISIGDAPR